MVYSVEIYADGGCRGNGKPGAIGAAAAAFKFRTGTYRGRTRTLPSYPAPTNQRAEITAIILALELALERLDHSDGSIYLDVKIYTDSKYAIGCMTDWIFKWANNGWINAADNEVANRDLIEEASSLDDILKREGQVEYIWIPREKNHYADSLCNMNMNDQEGGKIRYYCNFPRLKRLYA
jgi:ribonuclease HI